MIISIDLHTSTPLALTSFKGYRCTCLQAAYYGSDLIRFQLQWLTLALFEGQRAMATLQIIDCGLVWRLKRLGKIADYLSQFLSNHDATLSGCYIHVPTKYLPSHWPERMGGNSYVSGLGKNCGFAYSNTISLRFVSLCIAIILIYVLVT